MSTVRQFIYWSASIGWTSEAITAASTAALAFITLILAVGTLCLWLATKRLVRGAEKTAERQLRAYVINWRAIISNVTAGEIPEVEIEVKNFGQTPAYRVRHVARITLAIFPLIEDLALPPALSRITVGPGSIFFLRARLSEPLGADHVDGLKSGELAIYVVGEIRYVDAFARDRWTNYRLIYGGPRGIPPQNAMFSDTEGNEAN